jgi:molybdenum cofactor synthesis domain-containing protein
LSTGNEIVEPGSPLGPGQIYDINRFTISSVVSDHGGVPMPYPPAPDSLDALVATLEDCLANDVVVFSGGSSVGERDLIRDAIAAKGRLLFHGIALKPGKPTGSMVLGKPVFAMPGYPSSCLSTAHLLLVPLLRRLARLAPHVKKAVMLPLAGRVVSPADRHQFYTVRIENGTAVPAFKGSGDITSMSRADGYVEIPVGVDSIEAGAVVEVICSNLSACVLVAVRTPTLSIAYVIEPDDSLIDLFNYRSSFTMNRPRSCPNVTPVFHLSLQSSSRFGSSRSVVSGGSCVAVRFTRNSLWHR